MRIIIAFFIFLSLISVDAKSQIKEVIFEEITANNLISFIDLSFKYEKIDKCIKDKTIRIVKNHLYEEKNDSIISFQSGKNSIEYYKSFDKIMLLQIDLHSNSFNIIDNNFIGLNKDFFKRIFNLKFNNDYIIVYDADGYISCKILFENNKIKSFYYQVRFD